MQRMRRMDTTAKEQRVRQAYMVRCGMQAHNGSGKTTCFALAMLSRVDATVNQLQALCLCPTRYIVLLKSATVSCSLPACI